MMEVIINAFLLALIMAGAFSIIIQARRLTTLARQHNVAVSLCKNRLERARNFEYSSLELMAEDGVVVDDLGKPDPYGSYKRSTSVDTNYVVGSTRLVVTVAIKNQYTGEFSTSGQNEEQMETLLTDYVEPPE